MCWQGVELCTRDKRLKAGPLRGWCHPNNLFLNLDLWCKDLVPPKKNETVSDSGLSLCADRVLDFVQEMGDLKLALYGVDVTQTISSLVLICDTKTWSPKKENKTVWDTGLSLCANRVLDFVQEMGDLKLALYGVGVTQTISSLVLICDAKTWSPEKRIKMFRTLDCLYALIGCETLYKRWET